MLHCDSVLGHVDIDNWSSLDKKFPQKSLIDLSRAKILSSANFLRKALAMLPDRDGL